MRFARGDVRDHIVSHKKRPSTFVFCAKEGCSRRDSSESIFARFSVSSDFRLLQHYRREADARAQTLKGARCRMNTISVDFVVVDQPS